MVRKTLANTMRQFFPEPKDVYEALEPLHIICQIIGLAPYKTERYENGTKAYKCSVWTITRCVFLFVLFASGVAIQIFMFDQFLGKNIQENLQHLQDYFLAMITLVSVSFACIFAGKVVEVFQKIQDIDNEFQGLAVWMPYRRTMVMVILNIIGVFVVGICVLIWILILRPPETLQTVEIVEIAVFLPFLLLGYLMESQYVHYLNLLRHRYSVLSEYLEALVRESKTSNNDKIGDIKILREAWVTDEKEDNSETEKISKSILKSVEIISDPIVVIEKVASLHIKLSDTAMLINTAFSVQLLVRIAIAFICIVTALYTIGVNFSNPNADSTSANVNIMFTAWAGSTALELMMVVWVTNATCEEANKCPRLMHKIRNATKNAKLQDVIEMYSLQLYHNRLQFYICGLFPLDYTLLHTIVAGVTTYLVILIQFNTASNNNNATNAKKSESIG